MFRTFTIRRGVCFFVVAGLLLTAASCAHPQYWVKGLTLPPGSTEKSRTESRTENADAKPKPWEQPDGTLMVYFDCPANWDQVVAHIGDGLKAAGYAEEPNPLAGMGEKLAGKLPLGGGMLKDMAKGVLDYTHTYKKDDYTVRLTDMKSIMESKVYASFKKFRKDGGEPAGDYLLLVTKYKGGGATPGTPQLQAPGK